MNQAVHSMLSTPCVNTAYWAAAVGLCNEYCAVILIQNTALMIRPDYA